MTKTSTRRFFPRAVLLLSCLLSLTAWAQQPTATGVLNASVDNWDGIGIVFNSDSSGVALSGNGTANATLNFGTVSAYGVPPAGVSISRGSGNFTMSSPFQIYVNHGGIFGSNNFTLSAALASAPGVITFRISSTSLTTSSVVLSANDTRYGQSIPYTLSITVPSTAASQTISNTVNFSVVAN